MITGLSIEINGFGNAVLADAPDEEVVRILRACARRIELAGLTTYVGQTPIKDLNGNTVGSMSIGSD